MEVQEELPVPDPLTIRVQPASKFQGPPDAYQNLSRPRGAVFIANFRNFHEEKLKTREGSEVDVQHYHELFRQMGYERIGDLNNASKAETMAALRSFRENEIHNGVDSLVVIFMSHGEGEETLHTADGQLIRCEEIYNMFSNTNCKALSGKPKIFIFQFCRGNDEHLVVCNVEEDTRIPDSSPGALQPLKRKMRSEKKMSDIFICFSTLPGFVTYRHKERGSPYTDCVCRIFMDHAKDDALNALMRRVNRQHPKAITGEVRELGVTQYFFFNPENIQDRHSKSVSSALPSEDPPCVKKNEDTYANFSTYQGLVLIVNNLPGCQDDVIKICHLFSTLGYTVLQPLSNLTHADLMKEFEDFKQKDHGDSAIVIFYGDGFEDCLVSTDGKVLTFQMLTKTFSNVNCPKLATKPKVFILNTCFYDGEMPDEEVVKDPDNEQDGDFPHEEKTPNCNAAELGTPTQPTKSNVESKWSLDAGKVEIRATCGEEMPDESDMLLFSVEVDGGRCDRGSLLTEALYQILTSDDSSKELSTLLLLVTRRLKLLQGNNRENYFPETRNIRFQRNFYFIPSKPNTQPTPGTPDVSVYDKVSKIHRSSSCPFPKNTIK
ncbi:uncharacterized protein [Procambarus clarkii]|uniref:uncharacterized protein n=1 Tax=Procambarus clarkii TaxID=6728 RepID=UPI001E677DE6|nr:uncharacterized protein LOC123756154 [Procambarus clarkii]